MAVVSAAAGDFCNISWHPLIDDTVCNAEDTVRNVILVGGTGVVELLTNQPNGKKYVYDIINQCASFEPDGTCNTGSVLPVANYEVNIKIVPLDLDSTIVKWQANFDQLTRLSAVFSELALIR